MNTARMRSLEQRLRGWTPPSICSSCGGPVPGHSAVVIIDEADEEQPHECPECGIWIRPDGTLSAPTRTLPGRKPATKMIILGAD